MTTEVAKRQLLLVYDGDCPMCTSSVALLKRRGLVASEQAVSNHDLPPADLEAVQAAGIRNQLVVLDPVSRRTRTGADGLLWIVGENRGNPWWVRVASLPIVRSAVRLAYEAVSYNRRIISPPRHSIRCDCEPQVTIARRMTLVGPLAIATAAIAAGFGAAAYHGLGKAAADGALVGLAMFVFASVLLIVAAAIGLRGEQRIDYLAHQSVIAFAGAALLLPVAALTAWLPPTASATAALLGLLASLGLMWRMQRRRVTAVRLSTAWRWPATAAIGAALVAAGAI